METTLFSIGHGTKTIEEFIEELKSFDIQFLIDVRSSPFSKWAPHFNQQQLMLYLQHQNIKYAYMGNVIGGRPTNDNCFDEEGYYDYQLMAKEQAFQSGLKRLVDANSKGYHVAVMCSESDPSQCHRSKLIGRELYADYDIDMKHIVSVGNYISESQIITNLTHGMWLPQGNLFGIEPPPFFKSRKAYKEVNQEEYEYD